MWKVAEFSPSPWTRSPLVLGISGTALASSSSADWRRARTERCVFLIHASVAVKDTI